MGYVCLFCEAKKKVQQREVVRAEQVRQEKKKEIQMLRKVAQVHSASSVLHPVSSPVFSSSSLCDTQG